jgi:hypothetical protein
MLLEAQEFRQGVDHLRKGMLFSRSEIVKGLCITIVGEIAFHLTSDG